MKKVTHAANLDKLVENFILLEQKKISEDRAECRRTGGGPAQLRPTLRNALWLWLAVTIARPPSVVSQSPSLYHKIAETQGRNNLLEIQLEEANRLVKLTQTKENCMKEECVLLHGMIAGLQGTIQKQCDVRDENEHLKKCIQVQEEKLRVVEQEHKGHVEKLLLEVKTMEQEHKVERAEVQHDLSRKFEIKKSELNGIIDKKETEIQLLKRQLCSQEREKQSEIIKLQMEFNTKLVKIQSTSMKSPHQDSSALPQNIFKRKLQHLQEEKNQEIAALRRTIRELEQQRDCNQSSHLKRRRF